MQTITAKVIPSAPKFERIRRITGYLVGTIDRWNSYKRQELKDRVVHKSCSCGHD